MDKGILKKFAIESRKDLMEKIKNKINTFYIDEEFKKEQKGEIYVLSNEKHSLSLTNEEYQKRALLIKRIKELSLEQVIEEAAYTWFNRIIAIRYMEINDYLPLTKDNRSLGIRVLSSKDNTPDPEILKFTNLINPDLDIDFKKEKYVELKDYNEKFKYVLLLVCKKLGRVIPQVFDGITDYIDILIPDNLLNDTGFITKIINEVPVENYNQVEIIGWLYQYYNQTEKDIAMSSKTTYKKQEIPYVTQLFTPDWIVKYLVENSLGRFWIEYNGKNETLINNWKYYIETDLKHNREDIILKVEDIKVIDPCCGSGHILVYAFELLYQIYVSEGYNKNDIPELILKNNIYGLDIDDRAGQLSILSIILKSREYDKNIFNKEIAKNLNIVSLQESNNINLNILDLFDTIEEKELVKKLLDTFKNAKEYGSLLKVHNIDLTKLKQKILHNNTIFGIELNEKIMPLIKESEILSDKYDVVITNPPYMGANKMGKDLKDFLKKEYYDSKTDLCTAFMEIQFVKNDGYLAMINQQAWMFLGSFETLRNKIINEKSIYSMIHLGMGTFGADFGTTAFVLGKKTNEKSKFYRLSEYKTSEAKEQKFLSDLLNNENVYYANNEKFKKIVGTPIAYWASEKVVLAFENRLLSDIADTKQGLATGDNEKFLRYWFEVDYNNIEYNCKNSSEAKESNCKWFPCNKGGEFRKWYGNNYRVVDWYNDGEHLRNFEGSVLRNVDYYFREGLTWSSMTSSSLSMRFSPKGYIFETKGSMCYLKDVNNIFYVLGLLNSKVINNLLLILSPTLDYHEGPMGRVPIIINDNHFIEVENIVKENIEIAKKNWNKNEYSNEYCNYIIGNSQNKLSQIVKKLIEDEKNDFKKLKSNEERLNEIFIDIYGMNSELDSRLKDNDISIVIETEIEIVKKIISYAVGCMFGRYSLDKEGLIYAGGDFDEIYKKCKKNDGGWAGVSLSNYKVLNDNGQEIDLSFEVDNDNVIPITDEAYFSDDIVERFKTFISVVYGEKTLNENLDFIAETLGKKGTETSEDTIRRYFVNDFFNDHVKTYQKRPIYWLFDSGKKNGFKALVYMHRYNENLIPKVRLDYLHRMQTTYEKLLIDVNDKLTSELSMTDKKEAQKRQADLNAKLQEIKEYDEKIAHIANQRISIDLDDGVKVNYDKFKDILAKIK